MVSDMKMDLLSHLRMMMTSSSVCVGCAHARTCPFNPRSRGTAASKTDTGSLITPTVCGGAESDTLIDTEPTPSSGAGLSSGLPSLSSDASTTNECKKKIPL